MSERRRGDLILKCAIGPANYKQNASDGLCVLEKKRK